MKPEKGPKLCDLMATGPKKQKPKPQTYPEFKRRKDK